MRRHPVLKSYVINSFYEILKEKCGTSTAEALHQEHIKLSIELAGNYPNLNKDEKMHYYEQILLFIAAYKVLQKHEVEQPEQILWEIIRKRSAQAAGILRVLLKVPGLYKKVPQIANLLITKSFNEASGFQYSKTICTKSKWKADIVKCPYYEACKNFECAEIAHYFCDSDDLIYGNLHEKVKWKRTKTLGRGQEVCDFNVGIE